MVSNYGDPETFDDNGRFKKGNKASNGLGRPPGKKALNEIEQSLLRKKVDGPMSVRKDGRKGRRTKVSLDELWFKGISELLQSKDEGILLQACKLYADRRFGKAMNRQEIKQDVNIKLYDVAAPVDAV